MEMLPVTGSIELARWVASDTPLSISPEQMQGLWTFRIGRFGCRDAETRGGVIHIEPGRMTGGDSHFALSGHFELKGTELHASLRVCRHWHGGDLEELMGSTGNAFHLSFVADAISLDRFEGHSHREGYPEFRVVMQRLNFPLAVPQE